jgi:hypothetical protein
MNKEERLKYPCNRTDLSVYTDMQMFLVALEQVGVPYEQLYWCILNDKNKKLFALYSTWHYAGRPYDGEERWEEFKALDFSFIGDITS